MYAKDVDTKSKIPASTPDDCCTIFRAGGATLSLYADALGVTIMATSSLASPPSSAGAGAAGSAGCRLSPLQFPQPKGVIRRHPWLGLAPFGLGLLVGAALLSG
jgi:hypothetical protein